MIDGDVHGKGDNEISGKGIMCSKIGRREELSTTG